MPSGHFLSGIFSRTPGPDGSWLRCPGVASLVTGPGPGKGGARGHSLLTSDNEETRGQSGSDAIMRHMSELSHSNKVIHGKTFYYFLSDKSVHTELDM